MWKRGEILRAHSLSRTRTNGVTSPRPRTKLRILATRESKPASIKTPPKTLDPTYPAASMIGGRPPSTIVAPVIVLVIRCD